MATEAVATMKSTPAQAAEILSTVTTVATSIEGLIGAASGGSFNGAQVQQLTLLFTNLAQLAIKAAHDASGQEVTPESVLKLMPSAAPLAQAE
ncbi:MAG TPA: hypothetical protein VFK06_08790 [Candidatus Angelobacter sp.]|nr:hypothetical protein [Candidatus Angelobacter sp.]